MSTDLYTFFGTHELVVVGQPREIERQYTGFPGAHGLTSMFMGSRGKPVIVTGTIRFNGASYEAARYNLEAYIYNLEQIQWADAADYYWLGSNYYNVVWEKLAFINKSDTTFYWSANGQVMAYFIAVGRQLT